MHAFKHATKLLPFPNPPLMQMLRFSMSRNSRCISFRSSKERSIIVDKGVEERLSPPLFRSAGVCQPCRTMLIPIRSTLIVVPFLYVQIYEKRRNVHEPVPHSRAVLTTALDRFGEISVEPEVLVPHFLTAFVVQTI